VGLAHEARRRVGREVLPDVMAVATSDAFLCCGRIWASSSGVGVPVTPNSVRWNESRWSIARMNSGAAAEGSPSGQVPSDIIAALSAAPRPDPVSEWLNAED
jgi:hypothetical protein